MTARARAFAQVDVFSSVPYLGNPVAVVLDADGIGEDDMARFARWTNLSESAFVLPAISAEADYRLRIFTPGGEIPFAGHPTLGSAHAWLEAGGGPVDDQTIAQECDGGVIRVRRTATGLAFRAPELRRSGPLDDVLLARIAEALGIDRSQIIDHQWVDNGSGWKAVQLESADDILALTPDQSLMRDLKLGVVGAHPPGSPAQFELRAFAAPVGVREDPVTGSLNAGVAQWLIGSGAAPSSYTATQGTGLGRRGVVSVDGNGDDVWVGGESITCIDGTVDL